MFFYNEVASIFYNNYKLWDDLPYQKLKSSIYMAIVYFFSGSASKQLLFTKNQGKNADRQL